jgi:SAM-dependent methyltransferases related to tRNA (uracil-5-)-methyltransferase
VAVLNPPRKGCEESALRRVASLAPDTLIYVSCSPESLARDLAFLAGLGYCCSEIQPVDMFPQTMHVENIALLTKSNVPQSL